MSNLAETLLMYRKLGSAVKEISKEEVLRTLKKRELSGNRIDERVWGSVDGSKNFFVLTLEQAHFLSLIWHYHPDTRILTPEHESRVLWCVARRMIDRSLTFEDLASGRAQPRDQYKPEWFKRCLSINAKFDFDRFGWVVIVEANDNERRYAPFSPFYIYDGCGKTLVLTKKVLCNEIQFQQVEVLLLLPRPPG